MLFQSSLAKQKLFVDLLYLMQHIHAISPELLLAFPFDFLKQHHTTHLKSYRPKH